MGDLLDDSVDVMPHTCTDRLMDGCNRIGRCWLEFRWLIIMGAAVLAFALGYLDISQHQEGPPDRAGHPTQIKRSVLDRAYLASQLFVMEFNAPPNEVGWKLQIARFLAPLTTLTTAITAIAQLFRGQWQLLWFQVGLFLPSRRYRHVVICGLGWMGRALARGLRNEGITVVVVELDVNNDFIREAREQGMIVIVGNAAAQETLFRAKVEMAERLICVTGSDGINSEIAFTGARMIPPDRSAPLVCHVHIDDPRTMELLREREINAESCGGFRWQFFSIYERRADSLLTRETQSPFYVGKMAKWLTGEWPRPDHLVVVGAGRMGLEVVVRAARLWMDHRGPVDSRLRVTLVAPEATDAAALIATRYPRLVDYLRLRALDIIPESAEFLQAGFLRNDAGECEADVVYVCLDDDAATLQASLELLQVVRTRMIPVTACMYCDEGLSHIMAGADRQLSSMTHLSSFQLMQKLSPPDSILWGTHEILARAVHQFYVDYENSHEPAGRDVGFACDWEDLPHEIRESNRRHIDNLSQWMHECGFALDPCFDWHAKLWAWSESEEETLARRAHEWWRRERIAAGWVHGPQKNVQEKINPALVPWESLTEADRERALEFVRAYPAILARADLSVQPLMRSFEERIARTIHTNYVTKERARGIVPQRNPSIVPWEQLSDELRGSNIRQARSHFDKLRKVGFGVELLGGRMPEELVFVPREIERLAVLEHESWRREKENSGWRWGPRKDPKAKTHPCLVDWEQLPGIEKQKDRDAVIEIPRLLASAGYQVYRKTSAT